MQREHLSSRPWRVPLAIAAVVIVGSLGANPPARADVDVRLDLGNAPPAPNLYFQAEPHRTYDRDAGVYVVDDPELGDNDAFEYGGYDWLFSDGYWYRSTSWDGDFEVVAPQYVPTEVYSVPAYRWRHHPSYDSVHLRGWHSRDWQDLRAQDTDWQNRNDGNRDDYDRDVHAARTQYRASVSGDAGVHRRHHHDVHVGVAVGIHKSHHRHHQHVDRDTRDQRDDGDVRDDR